MPCAGASSLRRRQPGERAPLYLGSSSSSKKPSLVIPRLAPAKQSPFRTPRQPLFPPPPPKACFALADLSPGSPGNSVRLTRNFAVGRDGRAPTRGYKDVRSRVLFPIHFDGRLRVSGELAIAPNDVDVSLRGVTLKWLTAGGGVRAS